MGVTAECRPARLAGAAGLAPAVGARPRKDAGQGAGTGPVSRGGGLYGRAHEPDADGTRFWTVGLEASGPAGLLLPRCHWREDEEELGRPAAG